MAYLTAAEYATITGTPEPSNFAILEASARSLINSLVNYGLTGRTVSEFPSYVLEPLREMMAFQIMFLDENGLNSVNDSSAGSVSIGKFSYSGGGDAQAGKAPMHSKVIDRNIPLLRAYLRGVVDDETSDT